MGKNIKKWYSQILDWFSNFSSLEKMVFFGFLIEVIILSIMKQTYWWDETVYIGMAKYVYTGGMLGFWESFRPLGMPLLIGLFWKLGISISVIKTVFPIVFVFGIFVLTYTIAERIQKRLGILAAVYLAALPLYLTFANAMLSDVVSTFFGLLAIFCIMRNFRFLAGFAAGFAMLTRFPNGIVLIGIGVPILYLICIKDNVMKRIGDGISVLAGFITIFGPFLFFNWYRYGNMFQPFRDARFMMDQGLWMYDLGPLFYAKELIKQQFILFLVFGFLVFYALKNGKELRTQVINQVMIIGLLVFAYFTYLPHKEDRYIYIGLPYLVILASLGLYHGVMQLCVGKTREQVLKLCIGLLIVINLVAVSRLIQQMPAYSPEQTKFYHSFDNDHSKKKLLASNPLFSVFSDKETTYLSSWEYSSAILRNEINYTDAIAIDTCEYQCAIGSLGRDCRDKRQIFLKEISVFKKRASWMVGECEFVIYEVKV